MPVALLTIRARGGCVVPALMVSSGIGVVLARCCSSVIFRLQPIMDNLHSSFFIGALCASLHV